MWIAPYTRDAACKRWAQAECGLRNEKHDKIQDVDCEGLTLNPEPRTLNLSGFTLIEVIIVIVILGILSTLAAMIILQGAKSYTTEDFRGNAHYQAKLAMERMTREVRLVRSCADILGPANPSATLTFNDINGNLVTFSVAGGNLSRGADLLATGITSAQPFRFLNAAGNPTVACPGIWFIEINLTDTQGTQSLQMLTRVHPRNF